MATTLIKNMMVIRRSFINNIILESLKYKIQMILRLVLFCISQIKNKIILSDILFEVIFHNLYIQRIIC